jgi:small subunit ribosomal protein S5
MQRDRYEKRERKPYDHMTVDIRRVAKTTAGGRRMGFSAMVVAGDRNGRVGVSLGKGLDTRAAIEKAERKAAKNMVEMELVGDTIPHEIRYKKGAAEVLLRPAKPGSGIIAGSAARNVLELAGIENVYCKQLGSNDKVANTYATFEALRELRKGRVLRKMRKMRERVDLKKDIEAERIKRTQKTKKKSTKRSGSRRKVIKSNPRQNAARKNTKKKE